MQVEKSSKHAHEIVHLYELDEPLSLRDLIDHRFVKGALQKYQWVPVEMANQIPWEQRCVF